MSESKTYARRWPETIKARVLKEDDVVYDGSGERIHFHPGDMLIEPLGGFSRYVMSAQLFNEMYMEIDNADAVHQDLPPPESSDLRER